MEVGVHGVDNDRTREQEEHHRRADTIAFCVAGGRDGCRFTTAFVHRRSVGCVKAEIVCVLHAIVVIVELVLAAAVR